ncbi:hypothetical protein Agub_g1511 [Astrephomene gubernaculifera]|uniref:Uncharacterized protein n=1 Tax=Astrephomene gubernaculifera TaxID=47775 RepID=A0AAD3DJ06_9CHLO|nr:hypothetical protein Agub_g1511 [Astrephomene gubernaculifera]
MASLLRQPSCCRSIARHETRTTQQIHVASSTYSSKTLRQGVWRAAAVQATPAGEAANSRAPRGPPGDESSKQFAIEIARVADEVKCSDIVVLDVAPVVSWTSFLVIATVFSKPQLLAALARVEKAAGEQHGRARLNLPGSSPWETLDFGDVVLHLFTAEQREYYDIESFYAAAEEVELPFGPPDGPMGQRGGAAAAAGQQPTWSTKL